MKAAELQKQPIRKFRRLGSEKVTVASYSLCRTSHPFDIRFVKRLCQPYGSKFHVLDASDEEDATFCKEFVGEWDKMETHVAFEQQ